MRILYCNKYNFPFSGTEVYLFELMRMMREQGHEVALFSMSDPRGNPTPFDAYFVPHIDFKRQNQGMLCRVRQAGHAIYSFRARRGLREMISEFRPDVAHLRNIYHHLSPSILWELKRRHVPVLYHLNDFKLLCPSYNLTANGQPCNRCRGGHFWRAVPTACYHGGLPRTLVLTAEAYVHKWLRTYEKCVDLFLAPSNFVREKLMENGWPETNIKVLPHFQRIADEPSPPRPDAPILYFGRLSREKGLEDLLAAMRELPSIHLILAGEGPLHPELQMSVRRMGLTNIEFVGQLHGSDLQQRIAESRFTVLPSHAYETLGKTILESYAQSRAVVASDLGSRREFVRHGETGLLYPAGDVPALADTLSFLYNHPALAIEMGRAGREFVRSHHAPEDHYAALFRLYEQLVTTKKANSRRQSAQPSLVAPNAPKLKIAFIGGRGVVGKYSGIESYYEEVGQRLAAAGHEVTVYCRSYFTPPLVWHNGMRLVRLPARRSKHFDTALHTLLSTVHVIFHPANIVHYHTLGPSLLSILPRLAGTKTAVTIQGLDWQRSKWGRLSAAVLRLGEKAAIYFPHHTMVVSHTLQSYFRNQYRRATTYVPNGAILRERRPPVEISTWGIDPGNYILFLGRFSPEKNCHLLVNAYEHVTTSAQLVLAGGSNLPDSYSRELHRHASDHIRFLDYVSGDAFEELLTNAMFFVLPSDLEGLSLALLEAMGAGLCVLVSDIPENRELVDGAGFTFRHGNQADLERMLRVLVFSQTLREAAGKAARRRIQDQYQWSQIAIDIEHTYFRIMGWDEIPTHTSKSGETAPPLPRHHVA